MLFRAEKKIKHCRIKLEGRLYTIGVKQFESLVELIKYYEQNYLYKKIKLWFPVNEDIVQRMGSVSIVTYILYYLTFTYCVLFINHTLNVIFLKILVKYFTFYTSRYYM